ncbi:glycosyltransferase [Enterococcus sp. AZ109]|uniref:glycosyltransferase n=1 Tax=Enterococcus sp. AZ109 TaxID=2774634 RepID=UPI003F218B7F
MRKVLLAPNPTGAGHNMRLLAIGKKLKQTNDSLEIKVLLGSRQDVFTELFEKAGIEVIDLNPTGIIGYSNKSHLSRTLNWKTMITNYFIPTFFNGDKILKYVDLINAIEPDLLISDYNINASIAGITTNTKSVFVTERHNFTLVDVEINDLISGGFDVDIPEITAAQNDLNRLFSWLIENTDLVITDKVFLETFKSDVQLSNNDKVHFVGSMYVEREDTEAIDFKSLLINRNDPYIVGTVSNTTMLEEDKFKNLEVYINTFKRLKTFIPNLQLVLLGTSEKPKRDSGIVYLPYLPNWKTLIENSNLLVSHPGWITVTEVAYLHVPTVFYLPNFMEYHEVEAYRRLEQLGLPVFSGYNTNKFSNIILEILQTDKDNLFLGYEALCPSEDGVDKAIGLINNLIENEVTV